MYVSIFAAMNKSFNFRVIFNIWINAILNVTKEVVHFLA